MNGYDKNIHCSSSKVPVILVRLKENLNYLERLSKNTQISNFIKIRPMGVQLFHAKERTDRYEKLIVVFRNFANAPKKLNRKHALLRVSILMQQ